MTLSINVCWTCGKSLLDIETPEDTFFWCSKECYDKDDRYHGRRKTEVPEPTSQVEVDDKLLTKQERKRKIREALAEAVKSQKKIVGKQNPPGKPSTKKRGRPSSVATKGTGKRSPRLTKSSKPTWKTLKRPPLKPPTVGKNTVKKTK